MSTWQNWIVATDQIKNGYNFGYQGAIDYYSKMKKQMFSQIKMNKLFDQNTNAEIGELLTNELNLMINELSTKELQELTNTSLTTIQNWVEEIFEGKSGQHIIDLQQQINQLQQSIDGEKKKNTQQIKKLQQEIKQIIQAEEKIQALAANALLKYSPPDGSTDSVIRFLNSFLLNMIKWRVNTEGKIFINKNARTTLMGYYKEIIERKLFSDLFARNNIGIQGDLIAKENSISDLLLVFDSMSGLYGTSQNISIADENIEQQLVNFGAQIKSRNLEKVNTDFMKISHQASLRDSFNAQLSANGFNTNSWSCGVAFLGQTQNIIQSLGATNVLFITGPNRLFMDDFITNFRKQNMYLAFEMDDEHKATSQVGLQRFIENKKSAKFLARFR